MTSLVSTARARASEPGAKKLIRYTLVSVISVGLTALLQGVCFGLLKIDATKSSLIASTIAAVPSYYLNRSWVWAKNGKSHMKREVVPFWIMVFVGLAASAAASRAAEAFADSVTDSHGLKTLIVIGGSFAAFAVLWVLKFILFNKVLFAHRQDELDPALDGRAGLPT
jgi:putative flippase GtrA